MRGALLGNDKPFFENDAPALFARFPAERVALEDDVEHGAGSAVQSAPDLRAARSHVARRSSLSRGNATHTFAHATPINAFQLKQDSPTAGEDDADDQKDEDRRSEADARDLRRAQACANKKTVKSASEQCNFLSSKFYAIRDNTLAGTPNQSK